jgi:hypothetical protein
VVLSGPTREAWRMATTTPVPTVTDREREQVKRFA